MDVLGPPRSSGNETSSIVQTAQAQHPERANSVIMPEDTISLLLLGRPGHGKSSTGNSILGEKVFQTRLVSQDVNLEDIKDVTREVNGRWVQVVEGSGLTGSDQETPENAEFLIKLAHKVWHPASLGQYAAVVLILRYGVRFSRQEHVAVQMIKSLFGPEVIQRHGVIVMTCGDQFDADMEDEGESFQEWCQRQEGEGKELMEQCGHRVVLFDNKTGDTARRRQQVEQLMDMVDKVKGQAGPYTENDFALAEPERKKLQVRSKLPLLEQNVSSFVRDVTQRFNQTRTRNEATQKRELMILLDELQTFENDLQLMDQGTGCLNHLFNKIEFLRSRIALTLDDLMHQRPSPPVTDWKSYFLLWVKKYWWMVTPALLTTGYLFYCYL